MMLTVGLIAVAGVYGLGLPLGAAILLGGDPRADRPGARLRCPGRRTPTTATACASA